MVRGVDAPPAAAVTATALAFLVFTAVWRLLTFVGFTNDDYMHLAYAQQVLLGDWPVRDFADQGMPLMYLVSAGAQLVGGDTVGSELLVAAGAIGAGAALTVVAVAHLTGSLPIAALVTLLEVAMFPRAYSYPKMLLYGAAAAGLVATARHPSRRRFLILGVLVSIAYLFRHDHGLYIGAACFALAVLAGRDGRGRGAASHLGALAAGALPLLVAWALYVQVEGGLVPYFRSAIEYSRDEAAASGVLPRAAFDVSRASGLDGLYSAANVEAWLAYLFVLLPLVAIVLAWVKGRPDGRWTWEATAVWSLAVMALGADAGFLRDSLKVRLPDAAVPAAVLGAWILASGWAMSAALRRGAGLACRLGLVIALLITIAATLHEGDVIEQVDRSGAFAGPSGVRARLSEVAGELSREHAAASPASATAGAIHRYLPYFERCTEPGDRVLVTAFAPEVHVMMKRGFAGGHPPFNAGYYNSVEEQTRTVRLLERQPVPLVLAPADTYADFERSLPLVAEFVRARYAAIPETEGDAVRILTEKARISYPTDADTGWPCFRRR